MLVIKLNSDLPVAVVVVVFNEIQLDFWLIVSVVFLLGLVLEVVSVFVLMRVLI